MVNNKTTGNEMSRSVKCQIDGGDLKNTGLKPHTTMVQGNQTLLTLQVIL